MVVKAGEKRKSFIKNIEKITQNFDFDKLDIGRSKAQSNFIGKFTMLINHKPQPTITGIWAFNAIDANSHNFNMINSDLLLKLYHFIKIVSFLLENFPFPINIH